MTPWRQHLQVRGSFGGEPLRPLTVEVYNRPIAIIDRKQEGRSVSIHVSPSAEHPLGVQCQAALRDSQIWYAVRAPKKSRQENTWRPTPEDTLILAVHNWHCTALIPAQPAPQQEQAEHATPPRNCEDDDKDGHGSSEQDREPDDRPPGEGGPSQPQGRPQGQGPMRAPGAPKHARQEVEMRAGEPQPDTTRLPDPREGRPETRPGPRRLAFEDPHEREAAEEKDPVRASTNTREGQRPPALVTRQGRGSGDHDLVDPKPATDQGHTAKRDNTRGPTTRPPPTPACHEPTASPDPVTRPRPGTNACDEATPNPTTDRSHDQWTATVTPAKMPSPRPAAPPAGAPPGDTPQTTEGLPTGASQLGKSNDQWVVVLPSGRYMATYTGLEDREREEKMKDKQHPKCAHEGQYTYAASRTVTIPSAHAPSWRIRNAHRPQRQEQNANVDASTVRRTPGL